MLFFGTGRLRSPERNRPLATRIRWKLPVFLIWAGGVVLTLGLGLWSAGNGGETGFLSWAALAVEVVAGIVLFQYLDSKVFRPAEGYLRKLDANRENGFPSCGGVLEPVAEGVADRYRRESEEPLSRIRELEDSVRRFELLKRDLEETKSHLESKIQDLHSIYEVSTAIAGTLDTEELFHAIPERVMRTLGLNDFCILLYDAESRRLIVRSAVGLPDADAHEISFGPGEGVSWRVFEKGAPVYIPDVRDNAEFLYYNGKRMDVRSFMSVPMVSKGKAIGVLNVNHPEPNAFDAESLATMRVLATHIAIAIENAEMFRFVRTLADKDSLTLLFNHGAFHSRLLVELERAARYGHSLAVIMLDLDAFKEINDTHGHLVGDRILVMTAGVLCAHLRKSDVAARYGGDEFAVILPETDLAAASTIAGRIAAGISSVRLDTSEDRVISFTASIGYAACAPDSPNRETILGVADRLMYESKRRGPGGFLGEQL